MLRAHWELWCGTEGRIGREVIWCVPSWHVNKCHVTRRNVMSRGMTSCRMGMTSCHVVWRHVGRVWRHVTCCILTLRGNQLLWPTPWLSLHSEMLQFFPDGQLLWFSSLWMLTWLAQNSLSFVDIPEGSVSYCHVLIDQVICHMVTRQVRFMYFHESWH